MSNTIGRGRGSSETVVRAGLRWFLVVFYGSAGILHLAAPGRFLPIMPPWVPEPYAVILATGACELFGAVGLLIRKLRRLAGLMLAIYAVCVFPANLHHAFGGVDVPGLPSSWWYHGPRLLMQPVLVWAGLWVGRLIDWPFGRTAPSR